MIFANFTVIMLAKEDIMAVSFDKDISMELKQDEELLLRCAPQKASFVLSKSVALMPIALIWLCFDSFGISMILRTDLPAGARIGILVFFAFHLLPVWMWIYSIVKAVRTHKYIEYALTNERIIVKDKLKLTSYYYKDLSSVHVSIGLVDKLFKVGDIKISQRLYNSANSNLTLLDIANPHPVGKKLQEFIDSQRALHKNDDDTEYESYYEDRNSRSAIRRVSVDSSQYDDDDFYDDNNSPNYHNDFEEKPKRFTSKRISTPTEKNEEDDYLDNIMNTIKKKDEF